MFRVRSSQASAVCPLCGGHSSTLRRVLLAALLVLLGSVGCGLESPQIPHWTVALSVPLADRHVDGQYVAEHAGIEALQWRGDSGLVWCITASFDTVRPDDHLVVLGDQERVGQIAIDAYTLARGASTQSVIPLSDLHPQPVGFIAAFSGEIEHPLPPVGAVDSVQVTEGRLRIQVNNQLGLTLDSVSVALANIGSSTPFARCAIPGPILTGDSALAETPLDGAMISGEWASALSFHTPGGTILTAEDKQVVVTATLPDGVRAQSAHGIIDPLQVVLGDSMTLGGPHQWREASFDGGMISGSWTNRTPVPLTITWSLDDVTRAGEPISQTLEVPPSGTATRTVALEGCDYASAGTAGWTHFAVTAVSAGSNGETVTVEATDAVAYELTLAEAHLRSATGIVAPTLEATGEVTADLTWNHGVDQAGLDDWDLAVAITSTLPWATEVSGLITTDTDVDVPFTMIAQAGSAVAPHTTEYLVPHAQTPLDPLPQHVAFAGTVAYGDGASVVTIGESDFLTAQVQFRAPSYLYLDDVTITSAPERIALAEDDYGDRRERLVAGEITLTIDNRFPLGGTLTIDLDADSAGVTNSPALRFGPATIAPATSDGDGFAQDVSRSSATFVVGAEDMHLFEGEALWIAGSITLQGPGNDQPARIAADDYLDWNAAAHLELKVNR